MLLPPFARSPAALLRWTADAQLTGKTRIAVIVVLIAFAVAHVIGAMLLQQSSPATPDGSFRAAGYQD
jgi:hypothetical protein